MRFQTLYEGRWIFGILFVLLIIGVALHWQILAVIALLLILFCVNFFRDPHREISQEPNEIVSPADGLVVEIEEMEETEVTQQQFRRVAIFLSVFDVHVNRAPVEGKVSYVKHFPGEYLDARNPECSKRNEAMTWAFENEDGTFVVRQITGAIARRIVPWSKLGDTVAKGERFGMIRFGSRTEIYLPLTAKVQVRLGQKVLGGETVIARLAQ